MTNLGLKSLVHYSYGDLRLGLWLLGVGLLVAGCVEKQTRGGAVGNRQGASPYMCHTPLKPTTMAIVAAYACPTYTLAQASES